MLAETFVQSPKNSPDGPRGVDDEPLIRWSPAETLVQTWAMCGGRGWRDGASAIRALGEGERVRCGGAGAIACPTRMTGICDNDLPRPSPRSW
jgi:hypothetical protein